MWLDAPNGVSAGGGAWIRLSLDNEGQTGDALVAVTSPDVRRASLQLAGKSVKKINIPAGEDVDLEWAGSGVKLTNFRCEIKAGQTWFRITLTFEKSAPNHHDHHCRPAGEQTPAGMQDSVDPMV